MKDSKFVKKLILKFHSKKKKKIHALTLKIYFRKYTVWRECKAWFSDSSVLIIFVIFLDFFTLTCYKKSNDASIHKMISAVFFDLELF